MTTPESAPTNPPANPPAKADDRPAIDVFRSRDLLADCLAPRPGSVFTGKALDLATALGTLQEGKSRFDTVAAYWRTLRYGGEYLLWFDYDQQLQKVSAVPQAAAQLKTAQAASEAALHEAELAALAAQQELAAMIQWSGTTPPLPVDKPHVGAYRTQFEELFSGRSVPARARTLHQTLPLRRQVFEARAVAAAAALEVWTAAVAEYSAGRLDLARLLASLGELRSQKAAFLAAVCQYNQQIADYALNVVAPQSSTADVVAMLIKTSRKAAAEEKPPAEKQRDAPASGAVEPTPAGTPRPNTFATPTDSTAPRDSIYRKRER